jgi:hypothetical protein
LRSLAGSEKRSSKTSLMVSLSFTYRHECDHDGRLVYAGHSPVGRKQVSVDR